MINAMRWRTRVGAPWQDVPACYGPWWRAYSLPRTWQTAGAWEHRGRPPAFDPAAYTDRNAVERGFGQLKQNRALATRYDKLAVRYQATTHIASSDHRLKRLT